MFPTLARCMVNYGRCRKIYHSDILKLVTSKVLHKPNIPKRDFFTAKNIKKNISKDLHLTNSEIRNWTLVYSNSNRLTICVGLAFSLVVTGICPGILFVYFTSDSFEKETPKERRDWYIMSAVFMFELIVAVIITGLAYKRSMLRIYKNLETEEYVGILPKWIIRQEKMSFNVRDIERLPQMAYRSKMLSGTTKIKGRPFYLPSQDFKRPIFYNEVNGYTSEIYEDEYHT